jgi:histidyl-tRNA synthetase
VLYYALKQQGTPIAADPKADVYVISDMPSDVTNRMQLAAGLRSAGFAVAVDYSSKTLDRQRESAVKHGAKVLIIAGTPESRGGYVVVRDLQSKQERKTRLAAVVTEVGRHVKPRAIPSLWQPAETAPGSGEAPNPPDARN